MIRSLPQELRTTCKLKYTQSHIFLEQSAQNNFSTNVVTLSDIVMELYELCVFEKNKKS